MSSCSRLGFHIVFGTKYRAPLIREPIRERLYEYMGGIIRGLDGSLIEIGGIEDHVHLLVGLQPTHALADVIREIKANSSKWVNEHNLVSGKFEWQRGYSAFTVSYSLQGALRHYNQGQQEHHRVRTFEEEYEELLKKHDIAFERRYLFDEEHHA